ncbi:MAG: hypothetical protein A2Y17_00680 [Clostridiales bacterium GWF2_38_85]|nr:MAG: hypothetical protein A2Y17_00680 [Clostridiales bacterium GWF2_38_85]
MTYNSSIGEIFDTLYYGVIYFNRSILEKKIIHKIETLESAFEYFDEIKNDIVELSEYITPFFFYDGETIPFFIDIFIKNYYEISSLDVLLTFIKDKQFKKSFYIYVLKNSLIEIDFEIIENDIRFIHKSIDNIDYTVDIKYKLMFTLTNFEYIIKLLENNLINIYSVINKLHIKYSKIIKSIFNNSKTKNTLKLYSDIWKIDESKIKKSIITISLLNRYIFFEYQKKNTNELFLLLGIKHQENIQYKKLNNIIDIRNVMPLFSDPLRIDIIEALDKNGELTLSQLSRLLYVSTTTMQRHLHLLYTNQIIKISKQENVQLYYILNIPYIKIAIISINEFFNKLQDS